MRRLDSRPVTATSWLWEIVRRPAGSEAELSDVAVRNPTFVPDVADVYVFRCTASNGVAFSRTLVTLEVEGPPTALVSGGGRICEGNGVQIQAVLSGTPPWNVTWSDGIVQADVSTTPSVRSVSPAKDTVYTVARVENALGAGAASGAALVLVEKRPGVLVLSAPAVVEAGLTSRAVVQGRPGASYQWTLDGGVVLAGQGTAVVTFRIDMPGQHSLSVTEATPVACSPGPTNHVILARPVGSSLTFTRLAGATGGPGFEDGKGAAARFRNPFFLTMEPSGSALVTDAENGTVRRVSPAGDVTTWAGVAGRFGFSNGLRARATFNRPAGVAADTNGNVFILDPPCVRKVSAAGQVMTFAGSPDERGSADGPGTSARFSGPLGVVPDGQGGVFVSDSEMHTIRHVSGAGYVITIAGSAGMKGAQDGIGSAARFSYPVGLARSADGYLFVADMQNHVIRRVSPAGVTETFAGSASEAGSRDGVGAEARFVSPAGLTFDASGALIVTDYNDRSIRRITSDRMVRTVGKVGTLSNYVSASGFMEGPVGIVVEPSGNYLVTMFNGQTVLRVSPAGVVSPLAGLVAQDGTLDGTGSTARFARPSRIATGPGGFTYITEAWSGHVRRIDEAGNVETLGGFLSVGEALAVDETGNIFAEYANAIWKRGPAGSLDLIAGARLPCAWADGIGSTARFCSPRGMAVTRDGLLYIAALLSKNGFR